MHCYCKKKGFEDKSFKQSFTEFNVVNEDGTTTPDDTKYCEDWLVNYTS